MAVIDEYQEEQVNDASLETGVPVDIAQLKPMSSEDQAQSQMSMNEPPQEQPVTDRFPSTNRAPSGATSAVDLSKPGVEKQMWEEYNVWWKLPRNNESRAILEDTWYQKYYGMTTEEVKENQRKMGGFYPGANNPIENLQNTFQGLSTAGLGLIDFGMDFVGTFGGGLGQAADNKWDQATRLDNPIHQNVRRLLSVVIPAMYGGSLVSGQLKKLPSQMPRLQKALIGLGAFGAEEAAIIGISDVGEDHNALRALNDFFPGVFGAEGMLPIPDWAKTLDSDSPRVKKYKNMFDTAGLSFLGTTLGAFITIKGNKSVMDWFQPLDDQAAQYLTRNILDLSDPDKLIRIQEINEVLSTKKLSRQNESLLIDELETLKESLGGVDNFEDALKVSDQLDEADNAAAGRSQISKSGESAALNPDVLPIGDEASKANLTSTPGNVARNMADTTAIKFGMSEGDPATIITDSMREKGLMIGPTSRDAVLGVAEEARSLGRFNALVDGFRFTAKQMNAAAWDIYTSIIAAENIEDLKGLFLEDRDIKNLLMGRFKVEYINEEQARAAAFAMRDLTDKFLGRHIANSSARVMDTLGREASTMADAIKELQPFVDDNRAMDLVIEKLEFLLDEYALNKYIAGWSLRNKNWFDQVPPKDIDTVIGQLTEEFTSAQNSIHAKNLKFTKTLKELAETNPFAMRPLIDAFAHTNGDVDSLAKLMTWAANQVTPTGLLKSPDPKELNLFTRGAWGVVYNNVLSGLAAFRAAVGNTAQLTLRPITGILGHTIMGIGDEFAGMKRSFYYFGGAYETNRRAIKDAWTMMKKAHQDPEVMMKAYRKDFVFKEDTKWEILEDMRPVWETEQNWGRIMQYDAAKLFKDMAGMKALRYGMTGMVFPDVFSWTHMAHYLSRSRAYADVFEEFGFADWKKISLAEKNHYKTMFDESGLPTDQVLKAISGEITLNLDDATATWLNKGLTAYPVFKHAFMFPRTGNNWVKNSLSWTPISAIPGINKYAKTIWARTDDDIAAALAEHGIDFTNTPNAKVIFQNLRAEYVGRIAFSGLVTKTLSDYAMSGNIRGNGHYRADRRKKERNQFGYEPKTINLGGKWVSYKGIPGLDPILSILGDMAYYASDLDETMWDNWGSKLMWTISATFLNETPLQSMEGLVAIANNDLSGFNRFAGNAIRGWIPQSGLQGVLSNAITSSQKAIEGEVLEYVQNRVPIASSFLPEQRDIWTGEPLNDVDNPFLRILNALSPIKVSGTREPWRVWLQQTGWDGIGQLRVDSSGSYQYTKEEGELIYEFMGQQQMYKELIKLMNSKKYRNQVGKLRAHRATGDDLLNDRVKLATKDLPVIAEINRIVKRAQALAEARLKGLAEEEPSKYGHLLVNIRDQKAAKQEMKKGNVDEARNIQKRNVQTRELLKMSK